MYTRNFGRNQRYSPPPGYAGSTFLREEEVKHHLPEDEVKRPEPRVEEKTDTPVAVQESDSAVCPDPKENGRGALWELINNLKDRFDSEDLIILMVMLLIAQDGIGAEVLILALILIAG